MITWGGKDPDDVYGADARFINNAGASDPSSIKRGVHPQQMAMDTAGRDEVYGKRTHPWAHTVTQRPGPHTGQMMLPGMPESKDEHISTIRQANPNLNEYQFSHDVRREDPLASDSRMRAGEVNVFHPKHGLVGRLEFNHETTHFTGDVEGMKPVLGKRIRGTEVGMIEVHPDHAGKGIAEGMYHLAAMKGVQFIHSSERSEQGEDFARRVGGPRLKRRAGNDLVNYGGVWHSGRTLNPRGES